MGQALSVLLTSIPVEGELLRQFLIHAMQKAWSHSVSNPNLRSAGVALDNTRSKQTQHSISWLSFNASSCLCFFSQTFLCSSLSSGLKGCKQHFPQVGQIVPWMWGHSFPRGQSPAAANEQMGSSSGLTVPGLEVLTSSTESWWRESKFHVGFKDEEGTGLKSLSATPGRKAQARVLEAEAGDGRGTADEDEADGWGLEALTCSYLHRLP